MGEDALWEGLTGGGSTEIWVETEGFTDWEVRFDISEWLTFTWVLGDDLTSSLAHNLVDGTHAAFWGEDFNQEDWFKEHWLGDKLATIHGRTSGWHKLTGTSVEGVTVEGSILKLEASSSEFFTAENTLTADHLETRVDVFLGFM